MCPHLLYAVPVAGFSKVFTALFFGTFILTVDQVG
jgi:hypothetical protein